MRERILVFGAGAGGRNVAREYGARTEVVAFVDNDPSRQGMQLEGLPVIAPHDIGAVQWDRIVIASMYGEEIFRQLVALGVSAARIEIADHEMLCAGNPEIDTTRNPGGPRTVVYFPVFDSEAAFQNHYHRAAWYLPRVPGVLERVVLGTTVPFRPNSRPDHMCAPDQGVDHLDVVIEEKEYTRALETADAVLCWRGFQDAVARFADVEVSVLNVATDDVDAVEYGTYCGILWRLNSRSRRRELLRRSHGAFLSLADEIRNTRPRAAVVFGTGPSIDRAFEFDFAGMLTVVCNSTVQNHRLLDHLGPRFICAGDAVSHFGVSAYAAQFRRDLIAALRDRDCHLLTTAPFGWLLQVQHPEVADRVLLCQQTSRGPVYDLCQRWSLPQLDSTLNIHMLPLAATFCERIYILGCDGKNPDATKNEDFWAHSSLAQYHDLVLTGHLCHPTFDVRRQKTTLGRFQDSTTESLRQGEIEHGKAYYTLAPSFTEALIERLVPHDLLDVNANSLKRLR